MTTSPEAAPAAEVRETRRMMPILGRGESRERDRITEIIKDGQTSVVVQVPFALLSEGQAMKNHQQTLARLAHRGGLSRCEAVAIMDAREWRQVPEPEANARLNVAIAQWEAALARATQQGGGDVG